MLCSDGLTDLVRDTEIMDILRTRQFDQSPAQLIDLANHRGGHDNITVVTMEFPQPVIKPHSTRTLQALEIPSSYNTRRSTVSWWMIGMLLIAILSLVLLLVYLSNY